MHDLTLIIPAKKEAESLPVFLKEIKNYKCKKFIVLQKEDLETKKAIKNVEKTKSKVKKEIEKTLIDDEKTKQSIKTANININNIEQERIKKITQAKSNEEIKKIDNESKIDIEKELSNIEESTDKLSIIEQKKQSCINKLKKTEREKAIVIQNAKLADKHAAAKKKARLLFKKKIDKKMQEKYNELIKERNNKKDKIKDDFKIARKNLKKIHRFKRAPLHAELYKKLNKDIKEILDLYSKKIKKFNKMRSRMRFLEWDRFNKECPKFSNVVVFPLV